LLKEKVNSFSSKAFLTHPFAFVALKEAEEEPGDNLDEKTAFFGDFLFEVLEERRSGLSIFLRGKKDS